MEDFLSRDGCFLVHYGDVLTDQDFSPMLRFHRAKDALGTLLLHRRPYSNSIVELEEAWVNSGVYILSREIFRHIPEGFADLPKDVFPTLAKEGRLFGFPLVGYRCAVDSPKRYAEAQEAVIGGACRILPGK